MNVPKWVKEIKSPYINSRLKIPIYSPDLTENESLYVGQCLKSQWISSKGEFVKRFEASFAEYSNSGYAISCSSGSTALFLCLAALGIGPGDEVIVPSFTMIATAFAVTYTGAKPVFADCDLVTGNVTVETIERVITKKTKAIMPVHIYGTPCDMDAINRFAIQKKIYVIEDAAEALGSTYKSKKIGSISSLTAFSLYSNKIITTGEGGIITTSSLKMANTLRKINNYSFSKVRHFWHTQVGYNFRMSNIQAAVGLGQLEHIDSILLKKKRIADWYRKKLAPLNEKINEFAAKGPWESNYWHIAYRLNLKYPVMSLRDFLAKKNIETRGFFIPLHLQPIYRSADSKNRFINSEILAKTGILLPSGPTLTEPVVNLICETIKEFF